MKRIVVLISGSGTNLQAILDGCADGRIPAEVTHVFSNKKRAYGLTRAASAGVPTSVLSLRAFKKAGKSRDDYDRDLARAVNALRPDLVVLAGWMHVLSPAFLDHVPNVINLHPALPGELPGMHAIERAWQEAQSGRRERTGIMVHRVIPEVDAGPVLGTAEIPISKTESLEELAARVHAAEHRLLVQVIADLCHS